MTERETEKQKKRGAVSSVRVHINIWTTELSFSSADHHRVRDRHWVCVCLCEGEATATRQDRIGVY